MSANTFAYLSTETSQTIVNVNSFISIKYSNKTNPFPKSPDESQWKQIENFFN